MPDAAGARDQTYKLLIWKAFAGRSCRIELLIEEWKLYALSCRVCFILLAELNSS